MAQGQGQAHGHGQRSGYVNGHGHSPAPTRRSNRLHLSIRDSQGELGEFTSRLRNYLFLPDLRLVHAVLGSVAGNMLTGSPCWLMIVGPPGDGKTELTRGLLHVKGVEALHNVSGPASFLSATSSKERAKDATGGVLRKIGWHGQILFDDFTSVLKLRGSELMDVLDVFRQIYGGTWSRSTGSDGGKTLNWGPGKVGFLGGTTNAIDGSMESTAELGERFVYYRTASGYKVGEEVRMGTDLATYEKSRRAVLNDEGLVDGGAEGWQERMRDLVAEYFEGRGLRFGGMDRGYEKASPGRDLTDRELARLIHIGEVASRARSVVMRDFYSREIIGVNDSERAPRLTRALRQLYAGMEALGVEEGGEAGRWEVVKKVALDSMPALRRMVLERAWGAMREKRGGKRQTELVGMEELARGIRTGLTAVVRAGEDLAVHGCVEVVKVKGAKFVRLTDKMWGDLEKGWG